jgi:hypothetical protein
MYSALSALVARTIIDERLAQAEHSRLVREARRARRAQRSERRSAALRLLTFIPRQRTAPPHTPEAAAPAEKSV